MKWNWVVLALVLSGAGCECFLPAGKPPEGNILNHSTVEEPEKQIFDQAGAVDYFINELIRETMLHSPGMRIFVDADTLSYRSVQHIIRKSGEFSGISAASESEGALRLISRYGVNNSWQMELLSANGKSLWKRTVTLKN